jgi:DNA repair photolyase
MKMINRKSLLYVSGVEYGNYTINHVLGCYHGCKFPCYAFNLAKRYGRVKSYRDWIKPKLVKNAIEILDKEIPRYKNKINFVHMCFMSDPFMMKYPEIQEMSIKIIEKLNFDNIKVTTLTKGLYPKEILNNKKLSKENEYGITLVSLSEKFRTKFEPNTSIYAERLKSLKALHDAGYKTWVSIEPYPTPNLIEQNISTLLNKISFVDKIIFGRTNYNSEVTQYKEHLNFYNQTASDVIRFCVKNKIEYHIKKKTITNNLIKTKDRTEQIFTECKPVLTA